MQNNAASAEGSATQCLLSLLVSVVCSHSCPSVLGAPAPTQHCCHSSTAAPVTLIGLASMLNSYLEMQMDTSL